MSFVPDWPADVPRETQVERTWRAFGRDMEAAVQAILDVGRPPSEVAFAIGETVRRYFHTHGLALTEAELRLLVSERLALRRQAPALVTFAHMPAHPWTGGEVVPRGSIVPESIFGGHPSGLVRFASGPRQSPVAIDLSWVDRPIAFAGSAGGPHPAGRSRSFATEPADRGSS
ncbi:MAG: hypothetical protein LCH93_25590 [Proteobacteria bacterium]|nr:hypothetical protein [Pseudomonadota bacterium]